MRVRVRLIREFKSPTVIGTTGRLIFNMPNTPKYIINPFYGTFDAISEYTVYTPISITSFTSTPSTAEKGATVDDVDLAWALAGPTETDQTLDSTATGHEHIAPGIYASAYTGLGLTATNIWTLWVTDGTSIDSATAGVTFYSKRYWAPYSSAGPLTDPEILNPALFSGEYATSRISTKVYDCTGGKYIWYLYPATFGTGTFWVAGLQVTFDLTVQNHINASGYTASYNMYRSHYIQNGDALSVEVR
jgi:hypothetical protein